MKFAMTVSALDCTGWRILRAGLPGKKGCESACHETADPSQRGQQDVFNYGYNLPVKP